MVDINIWLFIRIFQYIFPNGILICYQAIRKINGRLKRFLVYFWNCLFLERWIFRILFPVFISLSYWCLNIVRSIGFIVFWIFIILYSRLRLFLNHLLILLNFFLWRYEYHIYRIKGNFLCFLYFLNRCVNLFFILRLSDYNLSLILNTFNNFRLVLSQHKE